MQVKTTGPAAGNGYEIILQGFNWESCKEPWYKKLAAQAQEIAEAGFTAIWLPPSSDSVSSQVGRRGRGQQSGDAACCAAALGVLGAACALLVPRC